MTFDADGTAKLWTSQKWNYVQYNAQQGKWAAPASLAHGVQTPNAHGYMKKCKVRIHLTTGLETNYVEYSTMFSFNAPTTKRWHFNLNATEAKTRAAEYSNPEEYYVEGK